MGLFRICAAALLLAVSACATPAAAQQAHVSIHFDTSLADRSLILVCSHQPVDEAAVRADRLVQEQIIHNAALKPSATMDAYVAGLRALSDCQAPENDPFNVAQILADPQGFRAKVAAVTAQRDAFAGRIEAMLAPYMPRGHRFTGNVVLAVPYFSCGGFSHDEYFFIDIACLNANLGGDVDTLRLLIAHETFHAIQAQVYFHVVQEPDEVTNKATALEFMFGSLLWEGMAEHVAPEAELANATGGGRLTQIFQRFAQANGQRMRSNFNSLSLLIDYVASAADDTQAHDRADGAYAMAFNGTYDQFGYFVGDRMARDIEQAWGRDALICVTQLPPEQFALAHDAVVTAANDNRPRLSPAAIAAAHTLAATRAAGATFERCRAH